MLDNITITIDDLENIVPDINSMKFDTQPNFDLIITDKKRELYGLIKQDYIGNYKTSSTFSFLATYGTNAQIDTTLADVRDLPNEEYLKNRLVRMVVAEIFRQNRQFDEMEVWEIEANKIPIKYYIDEDESETVGVDEEVTSRRFPSFHR
jgi:hypothetical protein